MASTASPSTSLARCRLSAGRLKPRQRSSSALSAATVFSTRAMVPARAASASFSPSAAALRRAAFGSDSRFSASDRVSSSLPAFTLIAARVSSNSRGHWALIGPRSARKVSSSCDSSCGFIARTRRSHGRQRAAPGAAARVASISASSSWLISSVTQMVEAAMVVPFSRMVASKPWAAASLRLVEAARKA